MIFDSAFRHIDIIFIDTSLLRHYAAIFILRRSREIPLLRACMTRRLMTAIIFAMVASWIRQMMPPDTPYYAAADCHATPFTPLFHIIDISSFAIISPPIFTPPPRGDAGRYGAITRSMPRSRKDAQRVIRLQRRRYVEVPCLRRDFHAPPHARAVFDII
jgi:hypothetical protein